MTAHKLMRKIGSFVFLCVLSICLISKDAHSAAADPRMQKQMQQQRAMKMRQAQMMNQAQQGGQSQPGLNSANPSSANASALPGEGPLPSPQEIKETIERALKSSSEWRLASQNMRDIIAGYLMNQYKDRGATFDKPAAYYRMKIDYFVTSDPGMLTQHTLKEIFQVAAQISPEYFGEETEQI